MNDSYPRGKLCDDDEGRIAIKIAVMDKTVIVKFGKPVGWFGMSASEVREFAALLLKHASSIDGEGGAGK